MELQEHPDAQLVQRFYRAFAEGDMAGVQACFASDAVWRLPGKSPIAGNHVGIDAIFRDFIDKLGPLSGGTFRAELIDVAVGQRFTVAVQHATAAHNGKTLDVWACQRITVKDSRIVEIQGHYSDQFALDGFWS